MSQAPGLSGIPDCGHCSSAATSAPCARSSARPTSPIMRVKDAISLADASRQTASIVRWMSEAITFQEEYRLVRIPDKSLPRHLRPLPRSDGRIQSLLLLILPPPERTRPLLLLPL